jgi:hypothetical protein
VKMYAARVGWLPTTSMSVDWSPCPRMDAGGILRVVVGDALIMHHNKASPPLKIKLSTVVE